MSTLLQILVTLKAADATALTAREAIQSLLGFGDDLLTLHRFRCIETTWIESVDTSRHQHVDASPHQDADVSSDQGVDASPRQGVHAASDPTVDASFEQDLARYLDRSVELWNPNRERCWVRFRSDDLPPTSWELVSGKGPRPGRFGDPDFADSGLDHVVVTSLDPALPTADFPTRLGALTRMHYRGGEIFTTRWRSSGASTERAARLRDIAEVRSRHQGLLVHPEFQDHLLIVGALPLPIWKDA